MFLLEANILVLLPFSTIINNMLKQAVRWDYITHNPNLRISKPKRARAKIQCYSPEEVDKLLEVLKNEPLKYQAVIQLALDLGCRRGELLGLTWDDINFKTGKIVINKSLQYAYGKTYEKETKTENSNRVNFISNNTIAVLKKYQKEQMERKMLLGSKWINTNRVFTTDYGGDMHSDTPTKIMDQIIAKYKLKRITFHGLRHTNISLMISKGVQSQIISRKVGHSSVQITDKIYSHFFEDEFKAVANVMDEFYLVHTKIEEILFASIYLMPSFYHIEFLNFFYFYWVVHKFYQAIQKK
jgi:integrase